MQQQGHVNIAYTKYIVISVTKAMSNPYVSRKCIVNYISYKQIFNNTANLFLASEYDKYRKFLCHHQI